MTQPKSDFPDFKLIMISAGYEQGGNVTHRHFDGHPELFVYPFESQTGTSKVADFLSSLVPYRYRWSEFPLEGAPEYDYEMFWDEEMKARLRTPFRSKFKDADLELDESERRRVFVELLKDKPRRRGNMIAAFFISTFEAWKNYNRTGREKAYVGYNPNIVLDTPKIFQDFPDAHIVHVARNPFSGYADTKKRPFPFSLYRYAWVWNIDQHMALTYRDMYPDNFHIVRLEDYIADHKTHLGPICEKIGISWSDTLTYPSWNGKKLEKVYPWGTIVSPTTEANIATKNELSGEEYDELKSHTSVMLKLLGYDQF